MSHGIAGGKADLELTPTIAVGDSPDVLDAISDPRVSACVWLRQLVGPFDEYPAYAAPMPDELDCLPPWLSADIRDLQDRVAKWSPEGQPRCLLETVRTRSCPTFHQDRLHARLVVAYRGAGVEFGGGLDGSPLFHTPRGAVALFKGKLWPTSCCGVLHRSPPASRGRPRWLLTMDLYG